MESTYRLRSCQDASDAEAIHSLVVELAVFEEQPNAVTQTVADFRRDGFETEPPLYFAALAEHKEDNSWAAVGLVVWYFTYSTWKGKSMYLEDCEFPRA